MLGCRVLQIDFVVGTGGVGINYARFDRSIRKNKKIEILKGSEIEKYIEDLGYFRIEIFKEYPYLYDGDMQYEQEYLSRYLKSIESILILLKDSQGLVGACTGIPLKDENTEFIKPFQENCIEGIFYIGEIMVRKDSRGKGLGTKLLSKTIDLIDSSKFNTACFYTVDRGINHPLKPSNYISPEPLWERYGFSKDPTNMVYCHWKDVGDTTKTDKLMNVWIKKL